jgi:hypothetical protein
MKLDMSCGLFLSSLGKGRVKGCLNMAVAL